LTAYDLPDLIGSIAPRKIVLADLRDQMPEPASTELINKELDFSRSVYSFKQTPGNLRVMKKTVDLGSIADWFLNIVNSYPEW